MNDYNHIDLGEAGIARTVPYDPTEDLAELAWEHATEQRCGIPTWAQDEPLWLRTVANTVGNHETEEFWVQVMRTYLAAGGIVNEDWGDSDPSQKKAG